MTEDNVSRRNVLRTTAAGVAATGIAGIASADEQVEINVGFDDDAGRQVALDAAAEIEREFAFGAVTVRASRRTLARLRNDPDVRYAEENGRMHALQTTPYGIEKVNADEVTTNGETGGGANIAVVDTGIDSIHETLRENLGEGWAAEGAACTVAGAGCRSGSGNGINRCREPWDDDNDHGTHVAGTAAAANDGVGVVGVAPDATLHAVKVLDNCGTGTHDDVAAGIEWAADRDEIDVLSMSFGGDHSGLVRDAVEYADQQGKVLVAAAGNDGPRANSVAYPAAYEEVIAVSATDENDDLADFSSTGPEIDLAAPGVDVLSTAAQDRYATFSGTSMACPHVAGGAATLIASGIAPDDVRQRLLDNADDLCAGDDEQGAGRLNVAAALDFLEPEECDDGDDCWPPGRC